MPESDGRRQRSSDGVSPEDIYDDIADHVMQARALADRIDDSFLSYLLAMALVEIGKRADNGYSPD